MSKDPSLAHLVDYLAHGDGSTPALRWADTSLTVSLKGLSDDARMLAAARAALDIWTEATGITFEQVRTNADISFGNGEGGAFAELNYTARGEMIHAHVNVAENWMNGFPADQRWGVGDYGLQTFIHEIGHALGLNHAGSYNGQGSYEQDAIFAKDTWKWSIMSYFDQRSDGSQIDYFISFPAVADVAAIDQLYGPAKIREGHDVYTMETLLDLQNKGTFTLVDTGGVDRFDFRGFKDGAFIDMRGGGFSTLGGKPNDFAVALGTKIENAIGSDATDSFTGNTADNLLNGGGYNDYLIGGDGNDTLIGGGGNFMPGLKIGDDLTGGAGEDVFVFVKAHHLDADRIRDFEAGVDIIKLKKIDADTTAVGRQAFDFIGTDGFGGNAGELRYEIAKGGTLVTGDIDGDGAADFRLELMRKMDLSAADFVL
ncbi:M10 family metallopeptidase C-terminal domain-containing protein [Hansschlegelia zhihuaiae]|uniref:Matrixin family metalloprotease n=1 Tax=Hansschlegelia zhihuaiae TaxID=405005 RepID=A0A4Q0MKN5_9HYPH|nr:M10 family metallopeptidase C-terminal domain-containing protein [Hansschlegelia zhihuaiae]RXF74337.1 matrixin family metalloprotease [Hansschlegelia zhihuaiae]